MKKSATNQDTHTSTSASTTIFVDIEECCVSKVRLYILITSQMHVRVAANTHSSLSLLELESHFYMMHTEYYLTTEINISQYPSKSIKFYTIENRQQKICSNLLASKSYLLLKTNTYPSCLRTVIYHAWVKGCTLSAESELASNKKRSRYLSRSEYDCE